MTFRNTKCGRKRTAAPMKASVISVRPARKIPSGIAKMPARIATSDLQVFCVREYAELINQGGSGTRG